MASPVAQVAQPALSQAASLRSWFRQVGLPTGIRRSDGRIMESGPFAWAFGLFHGPELVRSMTMDVASLSRIGCREVLPSGPRTSRVVGPLGRGRKTEGASWLR